MMEECSFCEGKGGPCRECGQFARVPSLTPAQQAFYDAAMEWGDWYNRNFVTDRNWSEEEGKMLQAYRAVLAEKEGGA